MDHYQLAEVSLIARARRHDPQQRRSITDTKISNYSTIAANIAYSRQPQSPTYWQAEAYLLTFSQSVVEPAAPSSDL